MTTAHEATSLFLQDLSSAGFYGSIAIKFEGGKVVHIRKEENLKPSALSEIPRSQNGNTTHSAQ